MRIYKGESGVEMSLEGFLDMLEEDAVHEVINMVNDLDRTGSIKGDFDGDVIYMGEINLNDYDGDISDIFDRLAENSDNYETMSQEDFEEVFGKESSIGGAFLDDDEILDNFLYSNEDLRVKRIVERFSHIESSS